MSRVTIRDPCLHWFALALRRCRVSPAFTPGTHGTWCYLTTLGTLLGRRSLPQIPSPPLLPCLARVEGSSAAHPGQAAEIRCPALNGAPIFVITPNHEIIHTHLVHGECMSHTSSDAMSCSRRACRCVAVRTADAVISESDRDEVRTQWLIDAWSIARIQSCVREAGAKRSSHARRLVVD